MDRGALHTSGAEQEIITPADNYKELDRWIAKVSPKKIFLVCGKSIRNHGAFTEHLSRIEKTGIRFVLFQNFQPDPLYENVLDGVSLYRKSGCDCIIAAGGGSAMDVAKCVRLWAPLDDDGADGSFLKQKALPAEIPFLVMPTTAGTGSEATRYAVIYYEGKKQSVTDAGCLPDVVLMDPDCLSGLPVYHKKAAMLDAFCHALESFWSVNSTRESKTYSSEAIRLILENMDDYLDRDTEQSRKNMLTAANIAGKAINITQTTAGHAMSYKITSLFGCAHGHSAALCDRILFPHMIRNTDRCIDPRGEAFLRATLQKIAETMGCRTPEEAADKLKSIFFSLGLPVPCASDEQYEVLKTSVDPVRLKNHPVALDAETIGKLYHEILS